MRSLNHFDPEFQEMMFSVYWSRPAKGCYTPKVFLSFLYVAGKSVSDMVKPMNYIGFNLNLKLCFHRLYGLWQQHVTCIVSSLADKIQGRYLNEGWCYWLDNELYYTSTHFFASVFVNWAICLCMQCQDFTHTRKYKVISFAFVIDLYFLSYISKDNRMSLWFMLLSLNTILPRTWPTLCVWFFMYILNPGNVVGIVLNSINVFY